MPTADLMWTVEILLRQHVELPPRPWTAEQTAAAIVVLRNAVDDFRDGLDRADDALAELAHENGTVTKRCKHPQCERWMVVAAVGRPREYCSDACRSSAPRHARVS